MNRITNRFLSSLLALSATALSATAAIGAPQWEVLIIDQQAPASQSAPAKWSTLIAGPGAAPVKKMDGFLASMSGKLWQMNVKTVKESQCCDKGKFPFSYEVDQLTAQPVGGGEAMVIFGQSSLASARDIMKEHISNCDDMKPRPGKPDSTESFERSKIYLLGSADNTFAVELITESAPYGRADSMKSDEWTVFNMDKQISVDMPNKRRTMTAEMQSSQIVKAAATQNSAGLPADISQYALSKKDMEAQRKAFAAAHPKLVDWSKVSFYTVAPDSSAVVYGLNGNAYWQTATGKPRLLGPVKSVRGVQWHKAAL